MPSEYQGTELRVSVFFSAQVAPPSRERNRRRWSVCAVASRSRGSRGSTESPPKALPAAWRPGGVTSVHCPADVFADAVRVCRVQRPVRRGRQPLDFGGAARRLAPGQAVIPGLIHAVPERGGIDDARRLRLEGDRRDAHAVLARAGSAGTRAQDAPASALRHRPSWREPNSRTEGWNGDTARRGPPQRWSSLPPIFRSIGSFFQVRPWSPDLKIVPGVAHPYFPAAM